MLSLSWGMLLLNIHRCFPFTELIKILSFLHSALFIYSFIHSPSAFSPHPISLRCFQSSWAPSWWNHKKGTISSWTKEGSMWAQLRAPTWMLAWGFSPAQRANWTTMSLWNLQWEKQLKFKQALKTFASLKPVTFAISSSD